MDGSGIPGAPGGNTLGKYRLIAELGSGGMADVYLAVVHGPAGFNKLIVIKQIRAQLAEDPEFLAMFLDEARLAARLSHPNVVQTNEVGHDGRRYFMAMEYLDGQPLNRVLHRLGRGGGLPLGMHLRVLSDVLAGLHHAHDLRDYDGTPLEVVHRDMSPHNVFVTYDGQVKIVDFGIAKAMNSSSETRTGVLKGKVAYMAPEQVRSERVDRRADVFSVGVMLWEAAAGRRLWKGMTDVSILARVTAGEVPSVRSVNPDVPPELEQIVARAMAHRRDDRYPTAAALQGAIDALLERVGDRSTSRDVGRLVASQFEEDRARMRSILEQQLRSAKSLPTSEYQAVQLPQIEAAPTYLGSSPTGAGVQTGSGSLPAHGAPPAADGSGPHGHASYTPAHGPPAFGVPPSAYATPYPSTLTAATSATGPSFVGPAPASSGARPIVVMAAALLVGAVGAFVWLQARPPAAAAAGDATSARAALAAAPPSASASVAALPSASAPANVPAAASASAPPASSATPAAASASTPPTARPVAAASRVEPPAHAEPPGKPDPAATDAPKPAEGGDDFKSRSKPKRPIDSTNPYAQ
jgi:serine/threonine-protein kinase